MSQTPASEYEHYQQTQPITSLPVQSNLTSGEMSQFNGHSSSSNSWGNAPFMTSEMAPMFCLFKCSECQISKSSAEDLEIHIKIEHLNWLPFQCTHCTACRASDNLMREHVHSHHKKTEYKYIYVDNPRAKRLLQGMIDRALSSAIQQMVARRVPPMPSGGPNRKSNGLLPTASNGTGLAAKRQRLHEVLRHIPHDQDNEIQRPSSSVSPEDVQGYGQYNGQFAHFSDLTAEAPMLAETRGLTDDIPSRLSGLFNTHKPTQHDDVDLEEAGISSSLLKTLEAASSMNGAGSNTPNTEEMLLKNVSSLFSADFNNLDLQSVFNNAKQPTTPVTNGEPTKTSGSSSSRRRNPAPNSTQWERLSASKKRVLGECIRCNKPVTAGARQMHLFYHLSKDENTFRFKCKFENCEVEHYRKDQMENHMSKVHGKIDHSMMEDRSVELYERVQKLSMELLGTGEFDDRRRKRPADESRELQGDGPISMVESNPLATFQTPFSKNNDGGASPANVKAPTTYQRTEETMECQLCKKHILTRTRGLHLLHHLSSDLGIVRYRCKFCDYKHDRPQSVTNHGKKEHENENCLEDSLANYTEDIKSLSKACFGLEQLFSKESRRKNRTYPRPTDSPAHSTDSGTTASELAKVERPADEAFEHVQPDGSSAFRLLTPSSVKDSPSKRSQSSGGTPNGGGSATKRKITNRRFGIRKPKSRKQRAEMAKLREVSMRIGGAMYFKKRTSDPAQCEVCKKLVANRLTQHAYSHLDQLDLYLCPSCSDMGHYDRNHVLKHLRDFHSSSANPKDNRMKFAVDIKEKIRECFPLLFFDAPLPAQSEMERLKKSLNLDDTQLIIDADGGHDDENESHLSDSGAEDGDLVEEESREVEQDENEQDDAIEPEAHEEAEEEPVETASSKIGSIEDAEMVEV